MMFMIPPQDEQVEQVPQDGKESKMLKVLKCLPKVIKSLLWKEIMRFWWFPKVE